MLADELLEELANRVAAKVSGSLELQRPRESNRWLDTKGAAEYLCLTEAALRAMVKRREIPVHKLGERLRFDPAELDAFVREDVSR